MRFLIIETMDEVLALTNVGSIMKHVWEWCIIPIHPIHLYSI